MTPASARTLRSAIAHLAEERDPLIPLIGLHQRLPPL